MEIKELINILRDARTDFKASYQTYTEIRDSAIKDAERGYIGENLKCKVAEINNSYNTSIRKLKDTIFNEVIPAIQKMKEQETKKISKFDESRVIKLKAIADLPLSTKEAEILASEYGGKDYFSDKILLNVLALNNIDSTSEMFSHLHKGIDTRMDVLDELQNQFCSMLDNYKGANKDYKIEILLSEQELENAEREFNNGVIFDVDDATEQARTTLLLIAENNSSLTQAILVKNAYDNADNEVKQAIKKLLSDEGIVNNVTLQTGIVKHIVSDDIEQETHNDITETISEE